MGSVRILKPRYETDSFLGVGPGRCGTLSLAKILQVCGGVECTHEGFCTTPGLTIDVAEMLLRLEPKGDGRLHGQVGAMWLGLVPFIRLQFPRIKVVCLHRDKESVVSSFLKRQEGRERPWIINPIGVLERVSRDFLEAHCQWAEIQMRRIEEPVYHLMTEELNSDSTLDAVFDFLGIDRAARCYPAHRRYHDGSAPVREVENQAEIAAFRAIAEQA